MVKIKRVYENSQSSDGPRFLVERLWPRGMKKESLRMEGWLKDIAPSAALRVWYGHDPMKWAEFRDRYFAELDDKPEAVAPILEAAGKGNVTLIYSARDVEHNNAVALKDYIEKRMHSSANKG